MPSRELVPAGRLVRRQARGATWVSAAPARSAKALFRSAVMSAGRPTRGAVAERIENEAPTLAVARYELTVDRATTRRCECITTLIPAFARKKARAASGGPFSLLGSPDKHEVGSSTLPRPIKDLAPQPGFFHAVPCAHALLVSGSDGRLQDRASCSYL